jgi:hypothetical protein
LLFVLLFGVAQAGAQVLSATDTAPEAAFVENAFPSSLEPLFSSESSYITRCRFVDDLKGDLQADEVAALLQFIASKTGVRSQDSRLELGSAH